MTPQEQQMLNDLANKIAQTPAPQIDPEADQFIRTRIGSRPDALYLLTQTVIIQNIALEHAKQQIQQLQQQYGQTPGSSFLGATPAQPQPTYAAPPPQPPPGATPVNAPSYPIGGGGGGGSSFLRTAATTAAGVAAGALAFEGIRSLFGGVEHLFGYGMPQQSSFMGGGMGIAGMGPSETIVNNYYDSPDAGTRDNFRDDDLRTDDLRDDSRDDSDSSAADDLGPGDDFADTSSDDNSSGDDLV